MRCIRCNAEIEEDSLFCCECGAKQEKIKEEQSEGGYSFCPNCGTKIEDGELFCSGCGARQGAEVVSGQEEDLAELQGEVWPEGEAEQPFVPYKKKGSGVVTILIFLLIALLIVGGIAFAGYKLYQKFTNPQVAMESLEEIGEAFEEELNKEEEIDLSNVDINAVDDDFCILEGKIKKADNGTSVLEWEDEISIYALDEMGDPVLAEDVTEIYVDDTWIDYEIMESVSTNDKVQVEGYLYIIGNSIYIEAETLYDEDGEEITADVLSNDYVIPHSDTVLLTNSDVAGLSLQEINYAKNEIYARHGRRFKSQELQNYFNSKSWYNGTIAPENFTNSMLSSVEQKNAAFLSDVEFSMSPNGYQLDK